MEYHFQIEKRWITSGEASKLLNVSISTIRRWDKARILTAKTELRRRMFDRLAIENHPVLRSYLRKN